MKRDKRLLSFEPGGREQWEKIIIYAPDEDGLADDPTEVATEAETVIATQAADSSDDGSQDGGIATPTQSLQGTESGIPETVSSILAGEFWGSDESAKQEPAQLTPTPGSNSGPPTRRLKVSHVSS